MKVKEIIYDWVQYGSVQDKYGVGVDWSVKTVGVAGVVEIAEHLPMGDGDKCSYLVKYEDGSAFRTFNPNSVEYFKQEEQK